MCLLDVCLVFVQGQLNDTLVLDRYLAKVRGLLKEGGVEEGWVKRNLRFCVWDDSTPGSQEQHSCPHSAFLPSLSVSLLILFFHRAASSTSCFFRHAAARSLPRP